MHVSSHVLYILNLYNVICQLDLNKAEKKCFNEESMNNFQILLLG